MGILQRGVKSESQALLREDGIWGDPEVHLLKYLHENLFKVLGLKESCPAGCCLILVKNIPSC